MEKTMSLSEEAARIIIKWCTEWLKETDNPGRCEMNLPEESEFESLVEFLVVAYKDNDAIVDECKDFIEKQLLASGGTEFDTRKIMSFLGSLVDESRKYRLSLATGEARDKIAGRILKNGQEYIELAFF